MTPWNRTALSWAVITLIWALAAPSLADPRIDAIIKPAEDFSGPEKYEAMSGGAATPRAPVNSDSFSHSSANLSLEQEMTFKLGNAMFRRLWVSAPASTTSADGLGPLFNARSCQRCHLKDGRGHPPPADNTSYDLPAMLLRLSVPPRNDDERALISAHKRNAMPEPTYGGQLQDFAVQGLDPEGKIHVSYRDKLVTLGDGSTVTLREPTYRIDKLGYGALDPDVMISPRVAPPMIGLGLLEMISATDVLAHADPDDADGDGISGRPNMVWNGQLNKATIGRFGWKAGSPTVRQQTAEAFSGDIGISTPMMMASWGDCTAAQKACLDAPHGGKPQSGGLEADAQVFDLVVHYARNLAVPVRRDVGDPTVLRGKKMFYESGCASCHVPKYVTKTDPGDPVHSHQLIWPYTDLLLHDMGPGLADNRPDGAANGREWRTAPLWGIGLTKTVSDHTLFLHDGRARDLTEAILWHGGEAEAAKEAFRNMKASDREDLIKFLESL